MAQKSAPINTSAVIVPPELAAVTKELAAHMGGGDRHAQEALKVLLALGCPIDPITPPGLVYTTDAFAALAASERIESFRCEYVGRMPYAKGYGDYPTYNLKYSRHHPCFTAK